MMKISAGMTHGCLELQGMYSDSRTVTSTVTEMAHIWCLGILTVSRESYTIYIQRKRGGLDRFSEDWLLKGRLQGNPREPEENQVPHPKFPKSNIELNINVF